MMLNYILLQTQQQGGSGMGTILMIVALIAIFYFFMIRPQSKKQKEMKKFRENMKSGDKVITAGGIHGRARNQEKRHRSFGNCRRCENHNRHHYDLSHNARCRANRLRRKERLSDFFKKNGFIMVGLIGYTQTDQL